MPRAKSSATGQVRRSAVSRQARAKRIGKAVTKRVRAKRARRSY